MKVIYKIPIGRQIQDAKAAAMMKGEVIEKIVITRDEWKELRRECNYIASDDFSTKGGNTLTHVGVKLEIE